MNTLSKLLGTAAVLLLAHNTASGQDFPQVVINDKVVMTIRTKSGGFTPAERAEIVRKRLGNILTMPGLRSEDVAVREISDNTVAIRVRERLLITVDRPLAQANSSTPLILANDWAKSLRELLPQVNVAVQMPIGPQVVVNNRILMTISAGGGAYSREERATVIRRRLGEILMLSDLLPEEITVSQVVPEGTASILVRGRLLIGVDNRLAKAFRTTPMELAERWTTTLREVLPTIRVEVRNTNAVLAEKNP